MIEFFIALGLTIMVAAGIVYLVRRQDIQAEKYRDYYDRDDGSLRV